MNTSNIQFTGNDKPSHTIWFTNERTDYDWMTQVIFNADITRPRNLVKDKSYFEKNGAWTHTCISDKIKCGDIVY